MPRYTYKCCVEVDKIHSISNCDIPQYCPECNSKMRRLINAPLVEGSLIYPVNLWNIRTPKNGPGYITVNNKIEHKKLLASRGFDSPSFHVGG